MKNTVFTEALFEVRVCTNDVSADFFVVIQPPVWPVVVVGQKVMHFVWDLSAKGCCRHFFSQSLVQPITKLLICFERQFGNICFSLLQC